LYCAELGYTFITTAFTPYTQNSRALHSAYLGKRALEAARGAVFAEIPMFCNLIIVRGIFKGIKIQILIISIFKTFLNTSLSK